MAMETTVDLDRGIFVAFYIGKTPKGGAASLMQLAADKNVCDHIVDPVSHSDAVERGFGLRQTIVDGKVCRQEFVGQQPVMPTLSEIAATQGMTIGEALEEATINDPDKIVDKRVARAIQSAEAHATGIPLGFKDGLGATAQLAAQKNDDRGEHITLSDILKITNDLQLDGSSDYMACQRRLSLIEILDLRVCFGRQFGRTLAYGCSSCHRSTRRWAIRHCHSVVLDLLKSYISDQKTQWERYLPLVEFAYNNTIHSSTGKAPFEIVEGAMKVPPFLSTKDKILEANKYTRDLDTAFAKVRETLQKSQERQKKAADCHQRDLKLKENDWVLLRFEKARLRKKKKGGKEKLSMRYYGPFQITEQINDISFRLRLPDTWKIHNVFHANLWKTFGDVPDEQPEVEENEEILVPEQVLAHKVTKKVRFQCCDCGIRGGLPRFSTREDFPATHNHYGNDIAARFGGDASPFADFQSLFEHPEIQQVIQNLNQQREEETHEEGKDILVEGPLPPSTYLDNRSQDSHGREIEQHEPLLCGKYTSYAEKKQKSEYSKWRHRRTSSPDSSSSSSSSSGYTPPISTKS
ncbi:hypothetical protein L7F22_038664 [Adiantum nelumboides]|nr:hypothetical protein [Adiantum nelumboides]